ncbi:hypothetical protein ACLESD_25785 [Pyxidicoccus sp. 3LFB2]
MSDTRVGATLTYAGTARPAVDTVVPVDSAGLVLTLDVPPGVELRRAALTVQAPGDDVTVDVTPGATLATSSGKSVLSASESLTWLSLDWGVRRPLLSLELQPRNDTKKGRLSVAEGGPWYPPTPSDTVSLGRVEALPGLMASRLMVEVVEASTTPAAPGAPKTLAPTAISSVTARAAARPADLSATLGTGTLFFHHAMPLLPRPGADAGRRAGHALQRAWPADLAGGTLAVTLRSSALGMLERVRLTLDTLAVIRTWTGGQEALTLAVDTDGEVVGRATVPPGQPLSEVRFTVTHRPRDERVALAPRPPSLPPLAHRCGSGFAAAQAFSALAEGDTLVGLDLHLRPLTRGVKGTLALFPDVHGRPGDVPLKGSTLELAFVEKGPPPWAARWVSLQLPGPIPLGPATWWAVLTVTEGEVLWSLAPLDVAPAPGVVGPLTALYRAEEAGPWLPREAPTPDGGTTARLWACTRPRLKATATQPPPPPQVRLRWGTRVLDVTPGQDGGVSLDTAALKPLTPPGGTGDGPPLEVLVRSRVAGEVILSAPRVTSPRSEPYALFPRK